MQRYTFSNFFKWPLLKKRKLATEEDTINDDAIDDLHSRLVALNTKLFEKSGVKLNTFGNIALASEESTHAEYAETVDDCGHAVSESEVRELMKLIPLYYKHTTRWSQSTSYGMKHAMEALQGKYVANGNFIAAAALLGFKYKFNDRVNCVFKMRLLEHHRKELMKRNIFA